MTSVPLGVDTGFPSMTRLTISTGGAAAGALFTGVIVAVGVSAMRFSLLPYSCETIRKSRGGCRCVLLLLSVLYRRSYIQFGSR